MPKNLNNNLKSNLWKLILKIIEFQQSIKYKIIIYLNLFN